MAITRKRVAILKGGVIVLYDEGNGSPETCHMENVIIIANGSLVRAKSLLVDNDSIIAEGTEAKYED